MDQIGYFLYMEEQDKLYEQERQQKKENYEKVNIEFEDHSKSGRATPDRKHK